MYCFLKVLRAMPHPGYSQRTFNNDIGKIEYWAFELTMYMDAN